MSDRPAGWRAASAVTISAEKDAEIGQDVFARLHRLLRRLAARHGIDLHTASDYLLAGALFTSADTRDMGLDDAAELARIIAASVQEDELPPATRH